MITTRIGIIGLSPGASWGVTAHLPAIRSLPNARISAVATTREESAREAAKLAGADAWFTDPASLADSPLVDVVVITVKVPAHQEAVRAALDAGKPVYCEWPLAPDAERAAEWAGIASAKALTTAVGLQANASSTVTSLRRLIEDGRLGHIRSVTAHAARRKGIGRSVPASYGYTLDATSRAGTREVLGGHLIGLVDHLVGIESLSALSQSPYPSKVDDDAGTVHSVTALDSFAACGRLVGGGIVALTWWDRDPAAGTRIVIHGTEGTAELTTLQPVAGEDSNPQITPLRASITWNDHSRHVIEPADDTLAPAARNLAAAYRLFLDDLRSGTQNSVTFAKAARLHSLIDKGVPFAVSRSEG
ncbi:MAG: Gfo/Idh/MocA family oxidoreductase [Ottowia sp.]|uniref:Gfo/Idh/MocA family protein n=1 Tax=Ottowia sp. TaxID=1898956 RepID=UPI0039E64681